MCVSSKTRAISRSENTAFAGSIPLPHLINVLSRTFSPHFDGEFVYVLSSHGQPSSVLEAEEQLNSLRNVLQLRLRAIRCVHICVDLQLHTPFIIERRRCWNCSFVRCAGMTLVEVR